MKELFYILGQKDSSSLPSFKNSASFPLMKPIPELLAPAGTLQKLHYAFAYGADAVYAGLPFFSLRARENDFSYENLKKGIEHAHQLNKKVYLTANIFARNLKIKPFMETIGQLVNLKPDAFIMSDPGLISIVKEKHPEVPIHLSVQANCMNWKSVEFWKNVGVSRIILSRELRLEEIIKMKEMVPDMELEAFVHGSICIAYSGRCLLSHYMSYRDANQGVCDNTCRYPMKLYEKKSQYYVQDPRSEELYPIDEDENGTYIMNAKDLRLIEFLKEIIEAGICSLKIEGRTKSIYYLATVTRAYRKALDDYQAGRPFDKSLIQELNKVSNRGYHSGFMMNKISHELQNYEFSTTGGQGSPFCGLVEDNKNEFAIVNVRNQIKKGQAYEAIGPRSQKVVHVESILNKKGQEVDLVHSGIGNVMIRFDQKPEPFSIIRALSTPL
ncbi:MAG: U32 family peptidase [Bdellovibrio sp.]|nr:MAG: U32 family peptidase [Bdellovibrio sp.]